MADEPKRGITMRDEYQDYLGDPEDEINEDEVREEEEDFDNIDFSDIFGEPDKEEEEEPEEEVIEEEPSQPLHPIFDEEQGAWVDPNTKERLFNQEEVNRIMGTARIKGREYEEHARYLEQLTGMSLPQIYDYIKKQQVTEYAEERGLPEEEASQILEDKHARALLEQQLLQLHGQQQQHSMMLQYNHEKQQYMGNPLVRKYEAEIDALAQGGQRLGWKAAMNYVLGEKAVSGDVLQNIQSGAERRVSQTHKPGMAPLAGGGTVPARSIPRELRFFADKMGVDAKEAQVEYERIKKERQRGL